MTWFIIKVGNYYIADYIYNQDINKCHAVLTFFRPHASKFKNRREAHKAIKRLKESHSGQKFSYERFWPEMEDIMRS